MGFSIVKPERSKAPQDFSQDLPMDEKVTIPPGNIDNPQGNSLELLAHENYVTLAVKEGKVRVQRGTDQSHRLNKGDGTRLYENYEIQIPGFGTYRIKFE